MSPVVRNIDAIEPQVVDRSRGAEIQVLLGPSDGVPNFVTRRFTLAPGGRIPRHRHDSIEHEQVMLSGSMVIGLDDREIEVAAGDCILIPPRVAHWYENRSDETAAFLCVVPQTADYQTEWLEAPVTPSSGTR
jgi:quercetin dioxygenase-like cupin family protein